MSTTFSTLKTTVTNYLGRSDSDIATRVGEFINLRQKIICRYANFPFLEDIGTGTCTAADGIYAISDYLPSSTATFSDYKEELRIDLRNTANNERQSFTKLTLMEFERAQSFNDLDETGQPTHYYVFQKNFYFHPIPDAAYIFILKGYCYLADLSADGDHNDLTDCWPEVIIYGATAEGASYYEDEANYQKYEAKYKEALSEMVKKEFRKKYANVDFGMIPRQGLGDMDSSRVNIKAFYE